MARRLARQSGLRDEDGTLSATYVPCCLVGCTLWLLAEVGSSGGGAYEPLRVHRTWPQRLRTTMPIVARAYQKEKAKRRTGSACQLWAAASIRRIVLRLHIGQTGATDHSAARMHEVMGGKDGPSMSGLDGAGEGPRNGSSDLQACVTLLQLVGIPVCHAKARRPLPTPARSITSVCPRTQSCESRHRARRCACDSVITA